MHMIRMLEPVDAALAGSECPALEQVGRYMQPGVSARDAWQTMKRQARRRGGAIDALTSGDCEVLEAFFSQLGESGREQQSILLDGTLEALRGKLLDA